MTITQRLATFAATLSFDDLSPEVVRLAKALTLDTLGTALAAIALGDGCGEVVEVMSALGGAPESGIIGHPVRVSAPNAAFANGALAHALNYDAIGTDTGHTGVVCLTPALAAAGAAGAVSGKRFLTAAVVAAEVTARLTHGAGRVSARVLAGQFFGYLGAAAGAGRIFELAPAAMHSAFGLAVMQVAGSRQVVIGGDPPAKAVYGAFPNHAGVLAALLARGGLGAQIDAVDGGAGLYGLSTDGAFDAGTLTDDLGRRFVTQRTQFKPWPVSGHVSPFIEAALELARNHDLRPSEIAAVELSANPDVRDWFEPVAERRHPKNAAAAANSAPFAVAKALTHRAVVLADFAPAGLRDEAAAALAERITHRLVDNLEGGIVAVATADGRRFEHAVAKPLGHHARPMTREQLEAKFRDCCSYAPGANADALLRFVDGLEDADDVSELWRLTTSG